MEQPLPTPQRILAESYAVRYPQEFAVQLEHLPEGEVVDFLDDRSPQNSRPLLEHLAPDLLEKVLPKLSPVHSIPFLENLDAIRCAEVLGRLSEDTRRGFLDRLTQTKAKEIQRLLSFSEDSAARLMDPRVITLRKNMTVAQALGRIRENKPRFTRHLFLVNEKGELEGIVEIQALALSEKMKPIGELAKPVITVVEKFTSREEILKELEDHKIADLPVVDPEGRLVGVIHYDTLVETMQEESTLGFQTMFGVSKDERALSKAAFAIRKRLPWLQINLLTAFLAASVVGIFSDTIAKFTALAILLPVVAGQSGNTGSQALAVTLRGLALREISVSHWFRVLRKEFSTGFVNGLAVALTTALGVFVWSGSEVLSLIIGLSMVLSMIAAGVAGATIPILLTALDQDPATSSSVILTTITDCTGFFTFLGIASLLSRYLG